MLRSLKIKDEDFIYVIGMEVKNFFSERKK